MSTDVARSAQAALRGYGGRCSCGGRRKIGVFRGGLWILDSNGTGGYEAIDQVFAYG